VCAQNLYELLGTPAPRAAIGTDTCKTGQWILTTRPGNDPELDPDREPEPPTKVIDKPLPRAGKRNAGAEGPVRDGPRPAAGGRGGRHEVFAGAHAGTSGYLLQTGSVMGRVPHAWEAHGAGADGLT
jgi:hypothetical protein